ncbi:hypothetical protein JB92DRAFT_1660586 [Gautieria morchelliformis]|nr:hypothetical protein JB92DRAFT_1660586 [Gautieria morchelliformis]
MGTGSFVLPDYIHRWTDVRDRICFDYRSGCAICSARTNIQSSYIRNIRPISLVLRATSSRAGRRLSRAHPLYKQPPPVSLPPSSPSYDRSHIALLARMLADFVRGPSPLSPFKDARITSGRRWFQHAETLASIRGQVFAYAFCGPSRPLRSLSPVFVLAIASFDVVVHHSFMDTSLRHDAVLLYVLPSTTMARCPTFTLYPLGSA